MIQTTNRLNDAVRGRVNILSCGESTQSAEFLREADFNFDWKFQLAADTGIVAQIPLADADWREVRLPHDWSVEASFDSTLEGCTGYLPGGVGWYQKHFVLEEGNEDKLSYVLFDGVYNNAQFWLNGTWLGENPWHTRVSGRLPLARRQSQPSVYVPALEKWWVGHTYNDKRGTPVLPLHISAGFDLGCRYLAHLVGLQSVGWTSSRYRCHARAKMP